MASRRNPVTDAQIVAKYKECLSGHEVAKALGLSVPTVYTVLKKKGVAVNKGGRRRNKVTDADIIKSYKIHGSAKRVATDLLVSDRTVWLVLKNHGVAADGQRRYLDSIKALDGRNLRAIKRLYLDGAPVSQLAERYQCSADAIQRALTSLDVEMRTKPRMTKEDIEKAISIYRTGMSFKATAEQIGFTERTVALQIHKSYPDEVRPRFRKGEDSPAYRGGKMHSHGYVYVLAPKEGPLSVLANKAGYASEHRLVMSRALGRPLSRSETVHHINGVTSDNRIENLQLRQGQHGRHIVMCCHACGSRNVGPIAIEDCSDA